MALDPAVGRAQSGLMKLVVQLGELRNASTRDANFKLWRQTTLTLIQRTWEGDVTRPTRFRKIPFSPPTSRPDTKVAREWYERGCAEAATLLRDLIAEIDEKGLVVAPLDDVTGPEPLPEDGGTMLDLGGPTPTAPGATAAKPAPTAHPVIPTRIVRLPEPGAHPRLLAGKPVTPASKAKNALPAAPPAPPAPPDEIEIEIEDEHEPPQPPASETQGQADTEDAPPPSRRGVSVMGGRGSKPAKSGRRGPRESLSRLLGFCKEEAPDPPIQGSAYVPPEPRVPESGAGAGRMHATPIEPIEELDSIEGIESMEEFENSDDVTPTVAAPPPAAPAPRPVSPATRAPSAQAPAAKPAPGAFAPKQTPAARHAPEVHAVRPAPPPNAAAPIAPPAKLVPMAEEPMSLSAEAVAPLAPTAPAGPLPPPEFQQPPDGTPRAPSRMEMAAQELLRGIQAFQARDEKALQRALESALHSMSPGTGEVAQSAPVAPAAAAPVAPAPHESEAEPPEDLLSGSPVFNVKARPIKRKTTATESVFTSLTAIAVAALSTDLASHGVPEKEHSRVRSALMELAVHLDHHDLTWDYIREAIQFLMDYPPVARRVLPLLLPHLDQAA